MSDTVSSPVHYEGNGNITCMKAMDSMMSNCYVHRTAAFWWGNAFKYLWRWPHKNTIEDLEKCKQCIDNLIEVYSDEL